VNAPPYWFDTTPGAYYRNLGRILVGRRFHCDPDEAAPGYDVTVQRISEVAVGVDSLGLFVGVTVKDADEAAWTFYSNGLVADGDDQTVGRHSIALGPDPSPIVNRRPDPLFDLATGFARQVWP
jgi:hypothetical protein